MRYPRDALNGMQSLSLEERGAYGTILDLLYDAGEPLRDSEREFCAHLNCDVRVWRRIRRRLIELGKIYVTDDGRLTNERAEIELKSWRDRAKVRRTSGAAGGQASAKSRQKASENNESAQPSAEPLGQAMSEVRGQKADILLPDSAALEDFDRARGAQRASLLKAATEAAGAALAHPSAAHGLNDPAPLIALLEGSDPCADLYLDVLPTIRTRSAGKAAGAITSWAYFSEAIAEARDQRLGDKPSSSPRSRDSRGARLAEDWQPSQADQLFAKEEGLDPGDIGREADRFRDYWCGKAGRDACKLDWSRTWRNWVRNTVSPRARAGPRLAHSASVSVVDRSGGVSFADVAAERRAAGATGGEVPGEWALIPDRD